MNKNKNKNENIDDAKDSELNKNANEFKSTEIKSDERVVVCIPKLSLSLGNREIEFTKDQVLNNKETKLLKSIILKGSVNLLDKYIKNGKFKIFKESEINNDKKGDKQ